jgi:hypothetical protein
VDEELGRELRCFAKEKAVRERVRNVWSGEGRQGSLFGQEDLRAQEIQVDGGVFVGAAKVARFGTSPIPPAGAAARWGGVVEEPKEVAAQVVGSATGNEPGILEEVTAM